jgi:tyrosyl-tRNA synthetase
MSISDELMWRYLELLSFLPLAEIKFKRGAALSGELNPRDVKFAFAQEIVERFHGSRARDLAASNFIARFQQGALPDNMPEIAVTATAPIALVQVLKQTALTASTSEAMRMIDQGGVRVDGERVTDRALTLAPGTTAVLQVGKRRFARVRVGA